MRFYFTEPTMVFRNTSGNTYTLSEISHGGHDDRFDVARDGLYIYIDGEVYWPTVEALPHVIDVQVEIERLDASTPLVSDALDRLEYVAVRRPYDVLPAVPKLEPLLDADDAELMEGALTILTALADDYPHELVPVSNDLLDITRETKDPSVLSDISACLYAIATVAPHVLQNDIPILLDLATSDSLETIESALETLVLLCDCCPAVVIPHADRIGEIASADSTHGQRAALVCLAHLTTADIEAGKPYFREFLLAIDPQSETQTVISEAVVELGYRYPDLVTPYLPYLLSLIDHAHPPIQRELLRLVIRQANTHPDLLEPAITFFISLLDSDDAIVRKNAVLILGTLETAVAVGPLESLQETESLEEVNWHIEWALQRISLAND